MDTFTHIEVPILNDEYRVVVCWGRWADAQKFITRHTDGQADFCDMDNDRGLCWFVDNFSYMPIIYITIPPKDKRFYSTLAHESCHAINAMWKKLGEESRDEIFAYSVGAIVGAVEKKLKCK